MPSPNQVNAGEWKKAAAKSQELQGVWKQSKPALGKIGILPEVTRLHSYIKQLKDQIEAENSEAIEDTNRKINDSLGKIINYYKGK